MYKKQMSFQKLVCYSALAAGLIVFIYSLGIMTDLYDCLYSTRLDPSDLSYTTVPGSIVYYNMQGFNASFLIAGIWLIVAACLLFITQTNNRRRYYIGNYVAIAIVVVSIVAVSIWAHLEIQNYRAQWLAVDFEALARHAKVFKSMYTESTFWFDIHYVVFGFSLIEAGLLVWNTVWKINLMKEEKRLVEGGRA